MKLAQYSDQELVKALQGGSEAAFEQLYHRYKFQIVGNLKRLLRSSELAGELAQELFLRIWDRRSDLDPEKSFKAYLFTIAERMVVDFFRKATRDKKLFEQLMLAQAQSYSHIEEEIIKSQDSELLNNAIRLLPPVRRKIFSLCKLEGKSYAEVSEMMGISVSTISDHLVKANRFLKAELQKPTSIATFMIIKTIMKGF